MIATARSHAATPTMQAMFIVLSVTGFGLLWGTMYWNGTLDTMIEAKEEGYLPDGRSLRLHYTGFPLLDSPLAILVIFFDGVTSGLDPGPRMLMMDITAMLQAPALWVLIESRRKGQTSALMM